MISNSILNSHSGDYSLQLSGMISQSIPVTPGATYVLTFYLSGNPINQQTFTIEVKIDSQVKTYTFDTRGRSEFNMGWEQKILEVTPLSNLIKLSFQSIPATPNLGPIIDDISLDLKNNLGQTSVPSRMCSLATTKSLSSGRSFSFPLSGQEQNLFNVNGNSMINSNSFILTPALPNQRGSIFYNSTLLLPNPPRFSVSFSFTMKQIGAEGLVFVISTSNKMLGSTGDGLGFIGSPSLGIKFDTYKSDSNEPGSNYASLVINGDAKTNIDFVVESLRFDDGHIWNVWVDYDGTNIYLRYSLNQIRPEQAKIIHRINLSQFSNQQVYFGFSSSTGSLMSAEHDIIKQFKFLNKIDPWDVNCGPGKYYDLSNGACRECALGTFNTGSSSCCLSCPLGYRSSSDRSSCVGTFLFYFILFYFFLLLLLLLDNK